MDKVEQKTQTDFRGPKRIERIICIVIGSIAVVVGMIGIIVPLLPTTPFLLLAAACYARSSRKLYAWLLSNRWCGRYIRSYRAGQGIPARMKALTIIILWITISFSAFFIVSSVWVKVILLFIAVGVTLHILMLPTYRRSKDGPVLPVCSEYPVEE